MELATLALALAVAGHGCASVRGGTPGQEGRAIAGRVLQKSLEVADATLVGRFIIEADRGQSRGSIRVRYIRPDIYRVDAFLSGAAGAGGGTSFLVEGDTTYVYSDSEGGADSLAIERGSVVPFLADFDLELEDLKSLAVPAPYLQVLNLGTAEYSYVRGGIMVQGLAPNGDNISIWIDDQKEVVAKALRLDRGGLPLVETKLSRFELLQGEWRPTRIAIRHFGQKASLSVQYDRISINEGLDRDDLLIREMS